MKIKCGGTLSLLTIALRNTKRNGRRTVLCIAAIGIAVFFTIVMQSMIEGMMDSIEGVVQVFDTGHVSIVTAEFEAEKEYLPVQYPAANGRSAAELAGEIRAIPGVKAVFPRITAFASLQNNTIKHAYLWGIKVEAETALNAFNQTAGSNGLVKGRYPAAGSNECAIGNRMAEKGGLKIGGTIPLKTVSAQFFDKMREPEITGIFEYDYMKYDEDMILVDFSRLQRLLVLGDAAQQIFIFADNPDQSRNIARELRGIVGENDVIREWHDNYLMIIHERIKEIGMMGSLGMTRREINDGFGSFLRRHH
jgi:putative ABC transport system permease protein